MHLPQTIMRIKGGNTHSSSYAINTWRLFSLLCVDLGSTKSRNGNRQISCLIVVLQTWRRRMIHKGGERWANREPQGLTRLSRTSFHPIVYSRVIVTGNHRGIPSLPRPWFPIHVHLIIANRGLPQDSRPTIQKHESKVGDILPPGKNLSNGKNNSLGIICLSHKLTSKRRSFLICPNFEHSTRRSSLISFSTNGSSCKHTHD